MLQNTLLYSFANIGADAAKNEIFSLFGQNLPNFEKFCPKILSKDPVELVALGFRERANRRRGVDLQREKRLRESSARKDAFCRVDDAFQKAKNIEAMFLAMKAKLPTGS